MAERLAAHRRSFKNMTVDVIDVDDVYNEFKKEWWDLSAVLYAKWLKDTSSFETKELSEQEW